MTDAEAAQTIRDSRQEVQHLAMEILKKTWRAREMEFINANGRTAYCDCIFFQDGDYVNVYNEAVARLESG